MIDEAVFIGAPLEYENIKIYPPRVKDVVTNKNFQKYLSILTMSQEDIEDLLVKDKTVKKFPTPFDFLFANAYENKEYENIAREALSFFFHEDVILVYDAGAIAIGDFSKDGISKMTDISQVKTIKAMDFFEIQNLIRQSVGMNLVELPDPTESDKVRRFKAKSRERERVKAKSGKGLKLGSSLAAICCMGIGLTPLTIGEMSYATVSTLIEVYQTKEKYETDIKSLLAGAESKKVKPKYWIQNY